MSFAHANGIKISYEMKGKGFPVIFIHGFGSKKEIWKPQVLELSKKFKTITYDLRGAGISDRPNFPYTMEMFADDIKGLMDFLHIKLTHLIGRSLGGMIAQNFVLKYPQCVEKLVLIATSSKFNQSIDPVISSRIQEGELLKTDPEQVFWNKAYFTFHQKFRSMLKSNPKKVYYNSFSLETLIKDNQIHPSRPQDIINQANAMKHHNTVDKLHLIKSHTLLLAASHDRLIPKSSMDVIHKTIPNSTLKIIQNAGHFMTLSRAPEVNQYIMDFLDN
ncbi:MAG: alpha/beta fold hydrolase [Promethearchaeota archaeon]